MASQSSHYVPYQPSQAQDVQHQYRPSQVREVQQQYHPSQARDVQQQYLPFQARDVQQQYQQPQARDFQQQNCLPQAHDVRQQYHQSQARDVQQHYRVSQVQDVRQQSYHPQSHGQVNNATYAEVPNPRLPPRPTTATPSQATLLAPFPQQYFPPPPSPSGQSQTTLHPAQVRRRPVSVSAYPTTAQPNYSFGADEVSNQPTQYYPLPPPPTQPLQSHYVTQAASTSGPLAGPVQSAQPPAQYQYQLSSPAPQQPPHAQRIQSTPQVYQAPIDRRSPSPSQTTSREVSESQYYRPQPNQRAYSPSPSASQAQSRELSESQDDWQPPNPGAYSPSFSVSQAISSEKFESQDYSPPINQLAYSASPSVSQTLSVQISEPQHYQQPPNQVVYSTSPSASQTLSREISASQQYAPTANQLVYSSSPSQFQLSQSSYFPSQRDAVHFDPLTYAPTAQPQQAIPGISVNSLPTETGLSAQAEPASLKKFLSMEKAKELLTKERAKDAFSKGKKLFNQFERIVEPIMPLLAAADPEIAAAYAIRQRMKANKQQQNVTTATEASQPNAATTRETVQANTATPLEAGQLVASQTTGAACQLSKDISVQGGGGGANGGGLENYGPLIAALLQASQQSEAQRSGAGGGQGNSSLEALLLAALSKQNGGQGTITDTSLTAPPSAQEKVPLVGDQPPTSAVVPAQTVATQGQIVSVKPQTVAAQPQMAATSELVAPIQLEKQGQDEKQSSSLETFFGAFLLAAVQANAAVQTNNQTLPSSSTFSPSIFSPLANASVIADKTVTTADTSSWVHHQARVFGLGDILLPAHHNSEMSGHTKLCGEAPLVEGFFQFELLHNDLQVQNKVKNISDLVTDDNLTLVQGLSTKNFGITTKIGMEGVLRPIQTDEMGRERIIYCAILQSPYGFGIMFSLNVPSTSLAAARGCSASILSSINWFDRKEICSDISPLISGSYRYYYSYSSGMGSFGSFRETKEYTLSPNGRYEYDRECSVAATVKDNYGNVMVDASGYNPDHVQGAWEAFEYVADAGGCRFLMLTENNGNVEVMQITGGEGGPLMIDGKKFHRVN